MVSTSTVIIFIVALLFGVGFFVLVIFLAPTIAQLKSLLKDVEKTSAEARELVINLQSITERVDKDLEKVDSILDSTKETVESAKHALKFIDKNFLKRSAGLVAIIPAIKMGWNFVKKLKQKRR